MRWIKLYDTLLTWRWAHKPEYMAFAVHCLLRANPMPWKWEKYDFPMGSFVTSMVNFSAEVGITPKQYRTILKNLQDCGFLVAKGANKFTLITICNFESYQENKSKKGKQKADEGQPEGNQRADEGQPEGNQRATDIDIENNRITNKEDKENKETFLKNGGTAEKKVFEISELEKILSAENIYMTAQGYQEFKNLNESDDRYGYKGGVIRSAKMFLKNPKNAIYRKNPPPAPPPQQKQAPQAPDPEAVKVWKNVKKRLSELMNAHAIKTWINPITAFAVKGKKLTINVPSKFFCEYLEKNYLPQLKTALNSENIESLTYKINA